MTMASVSASGLAAAGCCCCSTFSRSLLNPQLKQALCFRRQLKWTSGMAGTLHFARASSFRCYAVSRPRKNMFTGVRIQCSSGEAGPVQRGLRDYEFVDSAAEVELRIPCPLGIIPSTEEVTVNLQERSLLVTLKKGKEYNILLSIDRLYGQIKPAETIWFIDENEIVLSLKKAEVDKIWPDIMEAWHSLSAGLSKMLKGTAVYLVGDSSEVNGAVAKELALALRYAPLQTRDLLEQATKTSLQNLITEEGEEAVAEAEAELLKSLSLHARVVVATLGGALGAALKSDSWKSLHAGFTVWLCCLENKDAGISMEKSLTEQMQNSAYAMADVVVNLERWHENAARETAERCLRALKNFLNAEPGLPEKKSLYIRLGCRGDWPDIMPPGWNPSETRPETVTA